MWLRQRQPPGTVRDTRNASRKTFLRRRQIVIVFN